MESRLLYKASSHLTGKVEWYGSSETEWTYFGQGKDLNFELIIHAIESHLKSDNLYLVRKRINSTKLSRTDISDNLKSIAGNENFILWNEKLESVLEFNENGIFRRGKIKTHHNTK